MDFLPRPPLGFFCLLLRARRLDALLEGHAINVEFEVVGSEPHAARLPVDGWEMTVLGAWREGKHQYLGEGPPPEKGAFLEAVRQLVEGGEGSRELSLLP